MDVGGHPRRKTKHVRRWACPVLLMMIVAVAVVSEASTQETPSGWAQRNASGFGDPHNTLVLALAAIGRA